MSPYLFLKLGLDICNKCAIKVKGHDPLPFEKTVTLQTLTQPLSVWIQTDKSIYRPSETVRFRVFAVHPNLKLYNGPFMVEISDSNMNKLKVLQNVTSETGVVEDNFTLSDEADFGKWTIQTVTMTTQLDSVVFEVANYDLPKFEVTVVVPSYALLSDTELDGLVQAKYTYGEPVAGLVELQFSDMKSLHSECGGQTSRKTEISFQINGEGTFRVPVQDLFDHMTIFNGGLVSVTAFVTELATGKSFCWRWGQCYSIPLQRLYYGGPLTTAIKNEASIPHPPAELLLWALELPPPQTTNTTPNDHHQLPLPRTTTTTNYHHHPERPPRITTTTNYHHHKLPPPQTTTTTNYHHQNYHHHKLPPPQTTTTTKNYHHQKLPPPQTTTTTPNDHHELPLPRTTTTTNYHHKLPPPQTTTTTPNDHHELPLPRTTTTTNYHHHKLPPPQTTTTTPNDNHELPLPRTTTTTNHYHHKLPPPQTTRTTPNDHHELPLPRTTTTTNYLHHKLPPP
ncbi:hypothetical protein Btru_043909 [Bulinus truncatus]|nr:hypothetical protein Btru_043909 [Bulinus truncatus]